MDKEDPLFEEEVEDEEEEYIPPSRKIKTDECSETGEPNPETETNYMLTPSSENAKNEFIEQTVINSNLLKPDISDLPKQSNKDTLSYLKAKRIIRHKNNSDGGPDSKKIKSTESFSST